jgi:hypothetical protein
VTVLDERCGEQFTNCCKQAKSCKKINFFFFLDILIFFFVVNCDPGFEMNDNQRCQGMFL